MKPLTDKHVMQQLFVRPEKPLRTLMFTAVSHGWLQYNKESDDPQQSSEESLLTDSAFIKSNDRSHGKYCDFCKNRILSLPADSGQDESTNESKLFCCHDYQQFVQEFIMQGVSEETLQAVLEGRDVGREGKQPVIIDIRSQCIFGGSKRRGGGSRLDAAERCVVISCVYLL